MTSSEIATSSVGPDSLSSGEKSLKTKLKLIKRQEKKNTGWRVKRSILDTEVRPIWLFSCKSQKILITKPHSFRGQSSTAPMPWCSTDLYHILPHWAVIGLQRLKHTLHSPGHKHSNIPQGVETQPRVKKVTVILRWHQTASQQLAKDESLMLIETDISEYTPTTHI